MVTLSKDINDFLSKVDMWVLATADTAREPNAVPIFFARLTDDGKIMLVDNFMNKTIRNIRQNPRVSVSVWKDKTGYQFKGTAVIETSGAAFDAGAAMVKAANPDLPAKGVVLLTIEAVYSTSPGPEAGKQVL